jgi:hypothetical protein
MEGLQLQGILTERDIVRLTAEQRNLSEVRVNEVMTQQLVTLMESPSQTALTALALFYQHRIRHLPIVNTQAHLVGMITPELIRQVLQPVNLLKLRSISEVMTNPVIQAPATASVLSIVQQMAAHHVSCIVITEELSADDLEPNTVRLQPIGIITEGDIVQFQTLGIDLAQTQAQTVMSSPVFTLQPQESLWRAQQEMQARTIRRLVITDPCGQLLGIITQTSLLQVIDPMEVLGLIDLLQYQVQTQTSALEKTNQELQQQLEARQQVEVELRQAQAELEQRVESRTHELLQTNVSLQREIAEHQQTEASLRTSEAELRALFAAMSDVVLVRDAQGRCLKVAPTNSVDWLLPPEQLLGKTLHEVMPLSEADLILAEIRQTLALQQSRNCEYSLLAGDRKVWFTASISPLSADSVILVARNITQRKQIEDDLREALRPLEWQKFALDRSAIVAMTDRHGIITAVNEQFCRISQYSGAELIGQNHRIINSGYHPPEFFQDLWATIARGQVWQGEIKNRAKDGSFYWVDTTIVPFLDDQGQPFQYLAIRFDISDRKQTENALRQSEQRFRAIFDGTFQFMGLMATDGILIEANQTALTAIGAKREEVVGQFFWATPWWIHSPDLQIQLQQAILQAAAGHFVRFEAKHFLADGTFITVDFSLNPIFDENGKVVLLIPEGRDISDRKASEQKILEQAMLLSVATDGILVRDLENHIRFWNQGAERIYGWSAAEANDREVNSLLYRDLLPEATIAFNTVLQQGEWQGELQKVNKTGQAVIVQSRWTLIRDEANQPQKILSVDTDVTEKKQLEAQFLRTQRLESLGTLASGIAHDMNNVLTPILAASQLLPLRLPNLDERSQSLLRMLEESAKRGSQLVQQILSFARGSDGTRSLIQIEHLLREVVRVARQTFPKSVDISINLATCNLWMISADATQLHQVLMNLLINARDAMPDGGTLTIAAENLVLDENYARMSIDARAGSYVVVTIADTGTGIPPELLERIFEPFFTTKEPGKGTGLGLSTTLGIVKSHGGFVNVYSEIGQGTRFKIYLPAEKDSNLVSPTATLELPTGNGELVLVVDDEASVREITKASLETYNHRVMVASDGIEAIALYAQHQDKIQFILLDLMMPSLDSASTIRALQRINGNVAIVVMSGLSANEPIKNMSDVIVQGFLAKPFTSQELLQTLHRLKAETAFMGDPDA